MNDANDSTTCATPAARPLVLARYRIPDHCWPLDNSSTTAPMLGDTRIALPAPTGFRAVVDRGVVVVETGGPYATRAAALSALIDYCDARLADAAGLTAAGRFEAERVRLDAATARMERAA